MRGAAGALIALAVLMPGAVRAGPEPPWVWPVPPPHPVVRGFTAPATTWGAGHRGVDVAVPAGTEVLAPDDGVAAFAGTVVDRGVVSIDHGGVRSSVEPVEPRVETGERVARGEVIGVVAAGGSHPVDVLHIGARIPVAGDWAYVNPLLYLGGAEHAVLLPLDAFPA